MSNVIAILSGTGIILLMCCSFANSQERILFEDFSYTTTTIATQTDSAFGSVFGYNDWIEKAGIEKRKAWYRWNIDEWDFDANAGVKNTSAGLSLYYKKGMKKTNNMPCIHSSFRFRHGTYSSRVKFPQHHDNDLMDYAFWLFSPMSFTFLKNEEKIQYASEMDFEWNNWFLTKNADNLTAGCNNHNYKRPRSLALKTSSFLNGKKVYYDGFNYKINNQDLFYNQWFVCVFVVDTNAMKTLIYLKSDYDSLPNVSTFIGLEANMPDDTNPLVIDNYTPDYDMVIMYSVLMINEAAQNENNFETDWLFYSPETNVDFEQIVQKVRKLKNNNITRINTVETDYYIHDHMSRIVDSYLSGPDTIYQGLNAEWKIETDYRRWTAYQANFNYRYHIQNTGWSDWLPHYSNRFSFNSADKYDSLQLLVTLKDQWKEIRDTLFKNIAVIRNTEDSTNSNSSPNFIISPNPAVYFINILPIDTIKQKIDKLRVLSLNGSVIYCDIYKPLLDISDYVTGIYFIEINNNFYKFVKY
jgi:hypothetical protein